MTATAVSSDMRAAIEAANRTFMTALARGDAPAVAALYTAGGQLLPPGSDVLGGREAIERFWRGAMDAGIRRAILETVEVEGHGDTVHEVGRYTLELAGGAVADRGKYVVIWKRDGDSWRLHRDIWNSSQSAPA